MFGGMQIKIYKQGGINMLDKNECEKVETQTEFDLRIANERLKDEMSEKYQLERGIIEFVKILGKRSM